MKEFFEAPCDCTDCMRAISKGDVRDAAILKASFLVGDTVRLTSLGKSYAKNVDVLKFDLSKNVIEKIEMHDGALLYFVFGDMFTDEEIKLRLTKEQLVDARDWALDCARNEEEAEKFKDFTDEELERWVERWHQGGLRNFILNNSEAA